MDTGILIIIGWIICGVIHYPISFTYLQSKWPQLAEKEEARDRMFAAVTALFGPIALFADLLLGRVSYISSQRLRW